MLNFNYYSPTEFVFGRGAEERAGEMIRKRGGTKVLVHFGGGSAIRSGLMDRVTASLDAAGLPYITLGGVQPNPRSSLVYRGIELARAEGVDFILAVGGGSVIDSSKAIALGVPYEGDFWDFFCGKAKPERALGVGVVLTLAAAGSEGSKSCVITQEDGGFKRGCGNELNRPKFALMNPEVTYTLPAYQTACGATDMMAHVLERYFTNEKGVDLTDRLCEAVLSAVIKAAPVAIAEPDNYEARAQLMWASTLAHNDSCGLGREGDWASHQIEHELSARYDVAHGAGLAVVFPAWMRYQLDHDPMRFAQLAVRVWGCDMDFEHPEKTGLEGIERYEQFLKSIGMPTRLGELHVDPADIPAMAEKCKRNNAGKLGFFRPLDTGDIAKILYSAM
ncbi:MAG: iron-containing alcohol dehydrogenase [Clostridiales bacterium]|nr:iron-containing alcohol dehydrogenase [Clostridiales bacterium]MDY2871737.1 iron-containing alcohol dehydrogenase [Eubacteriales bacterium]